MAHAGGKSAAFIAAVLAVGVATFVLVRRSGRPTESVLRITPGSFGNYPAVFVSLDHETIRRVPKRLTGATIEGDLWVEPDDPEISTLNRDFEGAVHVGQDTLISLPRDDDEAQIGAQPEWMQSLPKESIRPGTIFFVKSSSGKLYRVTIDDFQPEAQSLTLRFAQAQSSSERSGR